MSRLKLIIFDLDGTLTDSLADLTDSVNVMLSEMGRNVLTSDVVRQLVGQGARNLVQRAMPSASDAEIEHGLQTFLAHNEAHIADKSRLYAGVSQTLEQLSRNGYRMTVISNKHENMCRKLLGLLGIDHYFADILGADSLPFRKPSPEPVLKVMADLGFSAAETVMVGDSINDVSAGRAAGVLTIGCTYGYGAREELADADYLVNSFAELSALLLIQDGEQWS